MATIFFLNFSAMPIIRHLVRIINDICGHLTDYDKILYSLYLRDGEYSNDNFFFEISYATPIIRLLIRVISDLKVTYNYLSDLNEILYTNHLKDGEYSGDNNFSNF